uniref:Variant surface glycoprotein 1125.1749 n=1 Tax=Trypanosoma brucei TaxID=5691 RepID=M4SYM8_9TRYP|nr:variant surface glycoprotein 1515 [Trypanosoma brucei]APD73884.1 variant surface glycoprotein 1125.1749 [Trypanosoma brucei]
MKFSKIAVALMAVCIFANGDGETAKEFRDICQIYNILRQPIPKPTLKVGADPTGKDGTPEDLNAATTRIFKDIKQLNVSVIQPEIAQILEDSTEQGKWQKVSTDNNKKGYFPEDDETTFEELRHLYKKTTTDPQGEAFRKQCSLPLNEREKFRVRQVFSQLWKTAIAKRKEILNRAAAIESQRRTARNAAITALYGKTFATTSADRNAPDKALSAEPTEADFPMTAATAMSTQCKPNADVEDAPGGALVSEILCLCGADTARGHTICQSTAMAAMSNNHEKEKGAENWAKLKPKCEALQPTQPNTLTAQTLTNALTRLFAHLGSNQQGTAAAPQDHAKLGKNSRSILGLHVLDNTSPPGCGSSNGVNTFNAAPHGACID